MNAIRRIDAWTRKEFKNPVRAFLVKLCNICLNYLRKL